MRLKRLVAVLSLAVFSAAGVSAAARAFFSTTPDSYVGTLADAYTASQTKMITRDDIYLPEGIDYDELGLYFFNGETGLFYAADDENLPFDPTKPTVIFSHGMGPNATTDSCYDWIEKGYNFGSFFWGVFSDDDPFSVQPKIWGNVDRWMGSSGMVYDDMPDKTATELFAADYYSVFSKYPDYSGFEIHLTGHSLGGQISIAVLSYFMAAVENGAMDAAFLPDRVTMLDPYLSDIPDDTYVAWLGRTVGKGGSASLSNDIADKALEMGVAISMLRTSPYVEIACAISSRGIFHPDYLAFKNKIFLTEGDTEFFHELYSSSITAITLRHTYALFWYEYMITEEKIIYDSEAIGSLEETLSPYNDATYVYARMGTAYALNYNKTENIDDDSSYSMGDVSSKICGFAFFDKNGNGCCDERIGNRFSGVTVQLFDGETLVASAVTGLNGYYSFDVKTDKEYTVKVIMPEGYVVSAKTSGTEYTANAFAAANEISATLSGARELQMFNIAVNKLS